MKQQRLTPPSGLKKYIGFEIGNINKFWVNLWFYDFQTAVDEKRETLRNIFFKQGIPWHKEWTEFFDQLNTLKNLISQEAVEQVIKRRQHIVQNIINDIIKNNPREQVESVSFSNQTMVTVVFRSKLRCEVYADYSYRYKRTMTKYKRVK